MPDLAFHLEGKGVTEWLPTALEWLTSIGKPLLIGLPLLAVLLAAVSYPLVRVGWRCHVVHAWRRRKLNILGSPQNAMTAPRFWKQATRELAAADPVLRKLITSSKGLALRSRGDAFKR